MVGHLLVVEVVLEEPYPFLVELVVQVVLADRPCQVA